ncbi:MAG: endonuclease III, partial [Bacilli bacterium]
ATELNYNKDYELLIAVMLSAQTTDRRVNSVTNKLFIRYPTLKDLNRADEKDIKKIIRAIGTYNRKAYYIKEIAQDLIIKYKGIVPNDKKELMKLKGIGIKTANVVTSVLFKEPSIAVDTHVKRVSKRLGLVLKSDNEFKIEKKLMKIIDKKYWSKVHHQMVLFGRYHCKAKKPECNNCLLKDICNEKDKN